MSLQHYFDTACDHRNALVHHRDWLQDRVGLCRLAFDQDTDLCREAVLDYLAGPAADLFYSANASDASDLLDVLSEVSLSFAFLATSHLATISRFRDHADWLSLARPHANRVLTRSAVAALFVSATGSGLYRRKNWPGTIVHDDMDGYRVSTAYPWVTGTHLARHGLIQFPVGTGHLAMAFISWRQAGIEIVPQPNPLAVLHSSCSSKMIVKDLLVKREQVLGIREFPAESNIGQAQVLPYVFGLGRALLIWAEQAAALRGQDVDDTLAELAYELEALSSYRRSLPVATEAEGYRLIAECRAQADQLLFRILHASHVCGGTLTLQGPLAERFGLLQREVSFCSVHFATDVTQAVLLERIRLGS